MINQNKPKISLWLRAIENGINHQSIFWFNDLVSCKCLDLPGIFVCVYSLNLIWKYFLENCTKHTNWNKMNTKVSDKSGYPGFVRHTFFPFSFRNQFHLAKTIFLFVINLTVNLISTALNDHFSLQNMYMKCWKTNFCKF